MGTGQGLGFQGSNKIKYDKIKLRRSARQFVQRVSCYRKHGGQIYTFTPPI